MKNKFRAFLDWVRTSKEFYDEDMYMRVIPGSEAKVSSDEHEKNVEKIKKRVYADDNKHARRINALYKTLSVLFTLFFAFVLVLTVSHMPPTGNESNPTNNEVAERYIEKGLEETGATNVVAGMILDYRAFDTLGESHVLFVAAVTVTVLLRLDKKKRDPKDTKIRETIGEAKEADKIFDPEHDTVLRSVALILVPVIMMFGVYVVLNGHLSPGGGFSGGAIIGAGLILFLNAYGFDMTGKFFTEKVYKNISVAALMFYALAKCYAFFCGANHLDSHISKGIAGHIISAGLILPLDIAVGCVVACTMYAFVAMFRKGGF